MSKLMDRMKSGRAAVVAEQQSKIAELGQAPEKLPPLLRPPGSPHGSVLAMKNEMMQHELTTLRAGKQVIKIDPKKIKPSKWANRHEDSFSSDEFKALKKEIESAGGNIQPIKVRLVPGGGDQEAEYEIIFGHRRHKACFDLGLQVLAMVESLTDAELFVQMDRENRERADLRPYEQGVMYAKAIDAALFPSIRKMSESLGVDVGNVSKAIALARLPSDIINAFGSPLDIQLGWATAISKSLQNTPETILAEAKKMQTQDPRPAAKQVLDRLVGGVVSNNTPQAKVELTGSNGRSGSFQVDRAGKKVAINLRNIDAARLEKLKVFIEKLMA